jgi:hypothetical protein
MREEVKKMTRYYLRVAKYFLSTTALIGFGSYLN